MAPKAKAENPTHPAEMASGATKRSKFKMPVEGAAKAAKVDGAFGGGLKQTLHVTDLDGDTSKHSPATAAVGFARMFGMPKAPGDKDPEEKQRSLTAAAAVSSASAKPLVPAPAVAAVAPAQPLATAPTVAPVAVAKPVVTAPAVAPVAAVSRPAPPVHVQAVQAAPPAVTRQPTPPPSEIVVAPAPPMGAAMKAGLFLEGVTMAFTGEMDLMTRADAEDKAKCAGAKVAGSCSSNTTYLVIGSHLDDGRKVEETSKYRKYMELKDKFDKTGKGKCPGLLDEKKFLALFPAKAPAASVPAPIARASDALAATRSSVQELRSWVDAHAPKKFDELVGNASIVKKLSEWLRDWDNVVLKKQPKKTAFKPGGGMPDNINARAILVSGPPGIGKTTTCVLAAQMFPQYEVLQYNASDARGMKIIQEMANGIADNTTIQFGGLGGQKKPTLTKKAVIIMDEVDGMGAGDRGGNAALIKMIKKTKNPIMCICNDEHSPKIRSLSFSCYHLKFSRPTKANIAERCGMIARREGLDIEPNALEALAESCGSDMRMVLNQLQMLSKSPLYKDVGMKFTDMKGSLHEMSKDSQLMLSPFDACKKLLISGESARLTFRERLDMFFVDHSMVGMLVQENMFRSVEKRPVDHELLERCAVSADLMTIGDIMNKQISMNQEWGLLPHMAIVSAVYPAYIITQKGSFLAFPSFPSFLGKYSTISRAKRLATELQAHVQLKTTAKRRAMITSGYTDLLYRRAVLPLIQAGEDAVETSVAVLDAYGLRREHLAEHLTELRQHLGGDDLFKLVDPKIKSAVTREFNSGGHAVKVMIPTSKKRKAEPAGLNPFDDEDDDAPKQDEEDEENKGDKSDDDTGGGMVKIKAKSKAKAKAKGKAGVDGDVAPKAKGRAKAKSK